MLLGIMHIRPYVIIIAASLLGFGCSRQAEPEASVPTPQPTQSQTAQIGGGFQANRTYDVLTASKLHSGPGPETDMLVNHKSSRLLGETDYLSIDPSVSVKVLAFESDWLQVQVVEPEHLSASHRGWVPATSISKGNSSVKKNGWIQSRAAVFADKEDSAPVGYLLQPAAVNVVDDGSGWLRLIYGPVRDIESDEFFNSSRFETGLYIRSGHFGTSLPRQ